MKIRYADHLYDLAFQVRDLIWQRADRNLPVIAVELADKKTVFVHVEAATSDFPGVTVYLGPDGLLQLNRYMSRPDMKEQAGTWAYGFLNRDGVRCAFESLVSADVEQLNDLLDYVEARNLVFTGEKDIPIFLELRPMHLPGTLQDETRMDTLIQALECVRAVCEQDEMALQPELPICCLLKDGQWISGELREGMLRNAPVEDRMVLEDELLLYRLRKLPHGGQMTCELCPMEFPVREEGTHLLCVPEALFMTGDRKTFLPIMAYRTLERSQKETWQEILHAFATDTLCADAGSIPDRIFYRGEQTEKLLRPICSLLDIELLQAEGEMDEVIRLDGLIHAITDFGQMSSPEALTEVMEGVADAMERFTDREIDGMDDEFANMILHLRADELTPELAERFARIQERMYQRK